MEIHLGTHGEEYGNWLCLCERAGGMLEHFGGWL